MSAEWIHAPDLAGLVIDNGDENDGEAVFEITHDDGEGAMVYGSVSDLRAFVERLDGALDSYESDVVHEVARTLSETLVNDPRELSPSTMHLMALQAIATNVYRSMFEMDDARDVIEAIRACYPLPVEGGSQ